MQHRFNTQHPVPNIQYPIPNTLTPNIQQADVMIAGGSEAAMTPLCFAGFCSMRAMVTTYNDDPSRASRPFDVERGGFVMGEGAGVLILETEEHALARGATIYCEVLYAIRRFGMENGVGNGAGNGLWRNGICLLYTSDAADE